MEFEKSKKYSIIKSIEYVSGGIASKQIIKKSSGNVTIFSFAEGEGLSEHTAPFDALVHIIEGEAEVIIDKQLFSLVKDEIIILPANVPHALHASKRFKMLLIMIKSEST